MCRPQTDGQAERHGATDREAGMQAHRRTRFRRGGGKRCACRVGQRLRREAGTVLDFYDFLYLFDQHEQAGHAALYKCLAGGIETP